MPSRKISAIIKGQSLVALPPDSKVSDALDLMKQRGIGSVLVAEEDRLLGIFTERDVVRIFSSRKKAAKALLEEVMTPDPDTVSSSATGSEVLQMMAEGSYRHVPVVDNDKLVGIVSRRDFFQS